VTFSAQDLEQIGARGLTVERVEAQLRCLREGFPAVWLDRPATLGDGLRRIEPAEVPGLTAAYEHAQRAGRVMKFVPASGAASRMFSDLVLAQQEGIGPDSPAARFLDQIEHFAFAAELDGELQRRGSSLAACRASADHRAILSALLDSDGLALADRPKGLVPFHHHGDTVRTPFAEHVEEAIRLTLDDHGQGRLHFTVPTAWRGVIAAHLEQIVAARGVALQIELSEQRPETDTVSLDAAGLPLRDGNGALVFRPGGHGALLANLQRVEGDIVTIKNIDNVVPDRAKADTIQYKVLLGGLLVALHERAVGFLRRLEAGAATAALLDEIESFLQLELNRPLAVLQNPAARAERAQRLLDRPLRVCGMVRNEGEPGGGPFWVHASDGAISLQVVEGAQVDATRPGQTAIFAQATHFSPVDFLCAVRDHRGRQYDLPSFVDPTTGFVSHKSKDGVELRALELPGLWNGSMAHWNTVLVEVPITTFSPVKTVLDLLRPEHARGPID